MKLIIKVHVYQAWLKWGANSGEMIQDAEKKIVKRKQEVLKRIWDDNRTAREIEDNVRPRVPKRGWRSRWFGRK
jgi:hypothetical protein